MEPLPSTKPSMAPQSICILRFSAIGDVCHAVATVQAIQKHYPKTKITWVIGRVEYQLVKNMPNVEFIQFDKSAGFSAYNHLRKALANRYFDILLHMQVSIRANIASLFIKAKQKWGFDYSRSREGQWLFTNHQISQQFQPHVAEGFLAFAYAIGVDKHYQPNWQLSTDLAEEAWFKRNFAQLKQYIVICPSASNEERNWLAERYAALADYASYRGYEVVLAGSDKPSEYLFAEKIIAHCCNKPINMVGKTNLQQMLWVLKHAELLIAPDTGPVHMAVMMDTPVIGLYMHSNPKRTGPFKYQQFVVSHYKNYLEATTGKSTFEHRWGKRLKSKDLMKQISVDEVKNMFDKVCANSVNSSQTLKTNIVNLPVKK